MNRSATDWVNQLEMQAHPEGGYYKETFRAPLQIDAPWGKKNALTSIFYLLEAGEFSAFHRIKSDELWYYHAGETLLIHEIKPDGDLVTHHLSVANPFVAIAANSWFASEVKDQHGYVLVSCAVAPGFDFADFEMAKRERLIKAFPTYAELITQLTRA